MYEQQLNTEAPSAPSLPKELHRQPRIRLAAAVGAALAVGIIAWALVGRGSSNPSKPTSALTASPIPPVALSAKGLLTLAASVEQPIYWAGPKTGYFYELTRTAAGNVFIRYLPPGVKAGAPGSTFLTIATYPFPHALHAVKHVANGTDLALPGGGVAVVDEKNPKSVHLAYPGTAYEIEVYDPSPATSREVALSGDVRPAR